MQLHPRVFNIQPVQRRIVSLSLGQFVIETNGVQIVQIIVPQAFQRNYVFNETTNRPRP